MRVFDTGCQQEFPTPQFTKELEFPLPVVSAVGLIGYALPLTIEVKSQDSDVQSQIDIKSIYKYLPVKFITNPPTKKRDKGNRHLKMNANRTKKLKMYFLRNWFQTNYKFYFLIELV